LRSALGKNEKAKTDLGKNSNEKHQLFYAKKRRSCAVRGKKKTEKCPLTEEKPRKGRQFGRSSLLSPGGKRKKRKKKKKKIR